MPTLYNPSRTPLPVSLRDGSATSIPAKGNLEVPESLMGSSDIAQKLRSGQLLRRGAALTNENTAPAAAEVVAPIVVAAPTVAEAPVETVSVESEDKSSKKSRGLPKQ